MISYGPKTKGSLGNLKWFDGKESASENHHYPKENLFSEFSLLIKQ